MPDFTSQFFNEFFQSIHSNQADNWDHRRFGPENPSFSVDLAAFNMRFALANFDHFGWVYDQFSDAASRDYLIRFVLYKILGHTQCTPSALLFVLLWGAEATTTADYYQLPNIKRIEPDLSRAGKVVVVTNSCLHVTGGKRRY